MAAEFPNFNIKSVRDFGSSISNETELLGNTVS